MRLTPPADTSVTSVFAYQHNLHLLKVAETKANIAATEAAHMASLLMDHHVAEFTVERPWRHPR